MSLPSGRQICALFEVQPVSEYVWLSVYALLPAMTCKCEGIQTARRSNGTKCSGMQVVGTSHVMLVQSQSHSDAQTPQSDVVASDDHAEAEWAPAMSCTFNHRVTEMMHKHVNQILLHLMNKLKLHGHQPHHAHSIAESLRCTNTSIRFCCI